MKLAYISEGFVLTVLEAAISRKSAGEPVKLEDAVKSAVQICIDADRAVGSSIRDRLNGDSVRVTVTSGQALAVGE